MPEEKVKPLNWSPTPGVGYSVVRRPDGGMHYTFTEANRETLEHWREFAEEHLLGSDRLTRNLFDLRALDEFPDEALQYALELNSDPAARYIRVAIIVGNESVRKSIEKLSAMTTFGGGRIEIFTEAKEAEEWLSRPLSSLT